MNKLVNSAMDGVLANFAPLILLSGVVLLSGCSREQEAESVEPPVRPAKIIEIGDPAEELTRVFPGTVVSSDNTVLAFRVGGRLQQLPVDQMVGSLVESGTLLAALDETDYRNALDDAEAAHELARAQFNRALKLVEKGYVSETEFDRLRARFKGKQAALNQARTNLSYTRLSAPFGGRIARLMVKNFESVKADDPIAILEAADKVDVEMQVPTSFMAQVPEEYKAGYRAGMRGLDMFEIEFKSLPEQRFAGSISEIETKPDPATLTYRVVVSLPAPEGEEILPGMTASVHLNLVRLEIADPALKVPVEALFSDDGQPLADGAASVWMVDDDMRVRRRAVEIGEITRFGIIIRSGLEPGDRIVGAGVHFLTEGTRVRQLAREGGL